MAIYRLILDTGIIGSGWRYATGATYPGCVQTGPGQYSQACDGRSYQTEELAAADALTRNEVPVRVNSTDEVNQILAGTLIVTPNMIIPAVPPPPVLGGGIFANIPTPVLIGGAVLLLMMLGKKRS